MREVRSAICDVQRTARRSVDLVSFSLKVWEVSGNKLVTEPIAAMVLHLSVGDTWNHINNVEKRLGVAVPVVFLVVSESHCHCLCHAYGQLECGSIAAEHLRARIEDWYKLLAAAPAPVDELLTTWYLVLGSDNVIVLIGYRLIGNFDIINVAQCSLVKSHQHAGALRFDQDCNVEDFFFLFEKHLFSSVQRTG